MYRKLSPTSFPTSGWWGHRYGCNQDRIDLLLLKCYHVRAPNPATWAARRLTLTALAFTWGTWAILWRCWSSEASVRSPSGRKYWYTSYCNLHLDSWPVPTSHGGGSAPLKPTNKTEHQSLVAQVPSMRRSQSSHFKLLQTQFQV